MANESEDVGWVSMNPSSNVQAPTFIPEIGRGGGHSRVAEVERHWDIAKRVGQDLDQLKAAVISSYEPSSRDALLLQCERLLTENAPHLPAPVLSAYQEWIFSVRHRSSPRSPGRTLPSSPQRRVPFAFKSRPSASSSIQTPPAPSSIQNTDQSVTATSSTPIQLPSTTSSSHQCVESIEGQEDATITIDAQGHLTILKKQNNLTDSNPTQTTDRDHRQVSGVTLKNLTRCRISLLLPLETLRIDHLEDCVVTCGPISGSVYVENAGGSTVVAGLHQLRVHESTRCNFFVMVKGPESILENCSDLGFAPYFLWHSGHILEPLFEQAGFSKALVESSGNWNQVRDFNCLQSQHSTSWQILSSEKQKAVIDTL